MTGLQSMPLAGAIAALAVMVMTAVLVTVLVWTGTRSLTHPSDVHLKVAEQLGGRFQNLGRGREAVITFEIAGRAAYMDLHPVKEEARTVLAVDMTGVSPGVLQIHPVGTVARLKRHLFGVRGIEIGNWLFDDRFILDGYPRSMVDRLFALERRARMIAVVRRLGKQGANIDLTRTKLTLELGECAITVFHLLRLAEAARELVELILEVGRAPDGVIWMGDVTISDASPPEEGGDAGQCQVCGTEMRTAVVYCASCSTPHHVDCWRYAAECSTYGCQETRYRMRGGGGAFRGSGRRDRQTPDEWLTAEMERDRRETGGSWR